MAPHTRYLAIALLAPATTFAASLPYNVYGRDLQVPSTLQGAWQSKGCYSDNAQNRVLDGPSYSDDSMTDESCISYCDQKGYNFAGTEFGRECYCGYELGSEATVQDGDCTTACAGDSSEPCGGADRISVFSNGNGPQENPGPDGWSSLGCYSDSVSARTLSHLESESTDLTVEICTAACKAGGYEYAGVEYASECYCGNSIDNGASSTTGCNMACKGDSSELCGGQGTLNLYKMDGSSSSTTTTTMSSSTTMMTTKKATTVSTTTTASTQSWATWNTWEASSSTPGPKPPKGTSAPPGPAPPKSTPPGPAPPGPAPPGPAPPGPAPPGPAPPKSTPPAPAPPGPAPPGPAPPGPAPPKGTPTPAAPAPPKTTPATTKSTFTTSKTTSSAYWGKQTGAW